MSFDFINMPDRRGRDAIAMEIPGGLGRDAKTPEHPDPIPLWIADMSFPTAPCVTEAMLRRMEHPIYGYFAPSDEYYRAICLWQAESFGTDGLDREHIAYENGVLGGVVSALRVLCVPGEPVLLHAPTYTGFSSILEANGFPAVLSPLKPDEWGIARMDLADMEEKIVRRHIHTAILCSPHNPTGRVWERKELEEAMELFRRHDVFVISDEIWSDLTLYGNRHVPTQSVSEDARARTVAFYAPSKTFNLAGLIGSYRIVYNERLRAKLDRYEAQCHYNDMNVLSMHALIGAYSPEGRAWLSELRSVLETNVDAAFDFFHSVDGVTVQKPQGTYVSLPDFKDWCSLHGKTMDELCTAGLRTGVLWRDGRYFHAPYGIRLCLALPTHKLREALDRLRRDVL